MLALHVLTIFASAALLFLVEPMFAKMVLPRLGGTPAVWTTCMVFFQAALLAGYGYAHLASKALSMRRHALLHVGVLALPFLALPVAVPATWAPTADANPIGSLLVRLALSVGLPFFAVATSGPLLQRWFSSTGHASAKDPYFLYAASNAGSLVGLLAYPFLLEPLADLGTQGWLWAAGYGAFFVLAALCAVVAMRSGPDPIEVEAKGPVEPLGLRRAARWVALAALPSSLLLGLTTHITTDICTVPLFWVVPLALYVVSFIIVFARRRLLPAGLSGLLAQGLLLLLVTLKLFFPQPPLLELVPHVLAFFAFSLALHETLADDRPPAQHLTAYYLLLSLGGVLGGVFNGVVAPLVFKSATEYPIAIFIACLLVPPARPGKRILDLALPLGLAVVFASVRALVRFLDLSTLVGLILCVFSPAAVCGGFVGRPVRFALGVAALFLIADPADPTLVLAERSYFGIHRVERLDDEATGRAFHRLVHGRTSHGIQAVDSATATPSSPQDPLSYYTHDGPIGQVFSAIHCPRTVGAVGLGAGTLTAYAVQGQTWTYHEIDPAVARIAEDPRLFTYVSDARRRGARVDIVLGDARLTIQRAAPGSFDWIFLDAFSSDSVPAHIITREAMQIYLEKLGPRGVIVLNISNRYLDLKPVVAALAADLGLEARVQLFHPSEEEKARGVTPCEWVVIARSPGDLGSIASDGRWTVPERRSRVRVWTDGSSNLLSILKLE